MRTFVAFIAIALCATANAQPQKKKKAVARPRPAANQPAAAQTTKPRIIGSTVVIVTKNGDRMSGEVLDLTAYSVRLKADNLESTIALDTIASLSFGGAPIPVSRPESSAGPVRADFARDTDSVLGIFQTMAASLRPGVDYTEYGRQLVELRRGAERLIARYSSTDNPAEAKVISLIAGALTDYTWARTIWTLKFGRSSDGTISESDSPTVSDALMMYPDLKTAAAASGNRLVAEKMLVGIWKKASEKQDRARAIIK